MRNTIFWVATAVALVVPNWLIFQKEQLLREGKSVYLRLAPVDPRSLMQGDYMILRYQISEQAERQHKRLPPSGRLVLSVDAQGVGSFRRLDSGSETLAANEIFFQYKFRKNRVQLGAESFFFQEGRATWYDRARYAELKVTSAGNAVLVGLCNDDLRRIVAPKRPSARTAQPPQAPVMSPPPRPSTSSRSSASSRPSSASSLPR
ncbi:GDYXXLXY domain-containing protein [Myxococcota bacterium]|nr:GDYXXLXY domain-containing protein [Myxococcota bacterium]